jgi:hypothetical protein
MACLGTGVPFVFCAVCFDLAICSKSQCLTSIKRKRGDKVVIIPPQLIDDGRDDGGREC